MINITFAFVLLPLCINATFFGYSLSECYFAGKGTALVLPDAAEVEGTKITDDDGLSLNGSTGRFGTTSDKSLSQENNTIQRHLQSMFYLLCPEDTLKMVGILLFIIFWNCANFEEANCNRFTSFWFGLVPRSKLTIQQMHSEFQDKVILKTKQTIKTW